MPEDGELAGRLIGGGHELKQRVYFEDTDFSGRVYHARYLHFLERGRSDYLRLLGIHHRDLAAEGLAFALRHMTINFIRPATIDDIVAVNTAPATISGARIVLSQTLSKEGDRLVEASVTVVLIGSKGRPVRLPALIRAAFAAV